MADEETQDETETTDSAPEAGAEAREADTPEPAAAESAVEEAPREPEAEIEAADEPAAAPAADATPATAAEPVEEPAAEPAADAEPAGEGEPAAVEPAADAQPEAEPEPASAPERKKRKRLPRALRHKHVKPARTSLQERKPITRTPKPDSVPGRRQERRGVVVSDKGDKTIVVEIQTIRIHSKYKKVVRRSSKLHAHDEQNAAGIGDVVRVVETRPLSKTKRWRLAEIVERAR